MTALRMLSVAICLVLPLTGVAAELFGPGVVSTAANETSATFTPDGRTVYFMRGDHVSGDTAILVADRTGEGWSNVRVAPFSGVWKDSEPHVTPDGSRLYFVSNRPAMPGGPSLTASMRGMTFPGANLWYVERTTGGWSAPVRVEGEINRVPMVYNPSVAANGNLYFSAHREDSGDSYQIYMARWNGSGFDAPVRQEVGIGVKGNHMDPAIDPRERFLLFAGNEGDSLGGADAYIVFRQPDGSWGKPIHLGDEINSRQLENAPTMGRAFGEVYVTSMRAPEVVFPKPRQDLAAFSRRLESPLNGSRNVWKLDISALLREHGIAD